MSKWLFWPGGREETDEELDLDKIIQALAEEIERNGEIRGEKI